MSQESLLSDAAFIKATIAILAAEVMFNTPDMAQRCLDELRYAVQQLERRLAIQETSLTLERGITLCTTPGCNRYATHFWNRKPYCRYHGRGTPGKDEAGWQPG